MNKEPLTESQKAILTEKLQERLLHAAIPAMVDELEQLTGEEVTYRLVYRFGKTGKVENGVGITFKVDGNRDNELNFVFGIEAVPDQFFDLLLSRLRELFL